MTHMLYFLYKYCLAFPGNINCQLKSITVRWKQGYRLKFTLHGNRFLNTSAQSICFVPLFERFHTKSKPIVELHTI